METNRRKWLHQMGLGLAGLSLSPLKALDFPANNLLQSIAEENNTIRLSSNENPYGPSTLARTAMTEGISKSNRYNWAVTGDLISAIAKKNNVKDENISIASGSTVILDTLIQYFALTKGSFVVAAPSYTSWTKTGENLGLKKIKVPLTVNKEHDLKGMLAAISIDTKFIYICNPNNPTGTICERGELVSFINEATKKVTVIIDEAYLEFSEQSSISNMVIENENVIVVKTFSKIYGLAGARIGYAIAHPKTVNKISELQTWANGGVSVVSRFGAMASLKDDDFVNDCKTKNIAVRKYTIEQLSLLNIICIPSNTNFIYFSLIHYKKDFFALLENNNILGTNIYEEEGQWTRITIGTMDEMQKFIKAIQ